MLGENPTSIATAWSMVGAGVAHAIMGEYWYDEGGFRVRKSARFVKANVTQDVEILYPSKFYGLEYSSEANTLSSVNNIYLNGVRIAALNEGGGTAYYLTDQVDSVSTVLDEDGKTLSRIQYQPYGETFVHKGDTDFSPKYNSQELDKETNFYFYNARYYDPAIARFTSADTVIDGQWDTQGWNRYSYVKGNPIRYKDPTGHKLYNVVVVGAGGNPMGHNVTLHVDDKTGVETYYEVTGPDSKNAHVYKRTKEEFLEAYRDRFPELKTEDGQGYKEDEFKPTESLGKGANYDVAEVKGVDESKTVAFLEEQYKIYNPEDGAKYIWSLKDDCATFSYNAYAAGGKEFTAKPWDMGENPKRWPRDLQQAIRFHNSKPELVNQNPPQSVPTEPAETPNGAEL